MIFFALYTTLGLVNMILDRILHFWAKFPGISSNLFIIHQVKIPEITWIPSLSNILDSVSSVINTSAVDKTRNMEHPRIFRNIPELREKFVKQNKQK